MPPCGRAISNPDNDFGDDGPLDVYGREFSHASGVCFSDDESLELIDDETPIALCDDEASAKQSDNEALIAQRDHSISAT
jgi:hypothetical protein